jgi:predicted secreted Zn-dependent protease
VGDSEWPSNVWRRSTWSGGGNCVEVSVTSESVLMRNSQRPEGPVVEFSHAEWQAFLKGVHDGQFDA